MTSTSLVAAGFDFEFSLSYRAETGLELIRSQAAAVAIASGRPKLGAVFRATPEDSE
ncbi:hypothetical protein [Bradyrhizobium sp. USDA 4353]